MFELLIGSVFLSVVHALIPNHWIPMVSIGKTEDWTLPETLGITAIAGIAHTSSTILIGVIVGLLGYQLTLAYDVAMQIVAPLILVLLGIFYVSKGLLGRDHHHENVLSESTNSKSTIISSLTIAMFLSPCIEIEAYYFVASTYGWLGISLVSTVYLGITVLGMLLLVALSYKGAEKIEWHGLEHHEKKVIGAILILVGLFAYFVPI